LDQLPMPTRKPPLDIDVILSWADHHYSVTGKFPGAESGAVQADPSEDWGAINQALIAGVRGLPGGDTLARLLHRERGRRHPQLLPRLTEDCILTWAQAHCALTGTWPNQSAGPVHGVPGEVWGNIEQALKRGHRGLPGGDSLARLLARRLGVRRVSRRATVRPLHIDEILAWADAYQRLTGAWPTSSSGPLGLPDDMQWKGIDRALRVGLRGLPGGSSLVRLLRQHRALSPACSTA
jgi:hypothetical protein